jgi:hypothetical protein
MVVAVFVLCLALGSLVVSALPRIPRSLIVGSQWSLVGLLFPLYLATPDVTYWVRVPAGPLLEDAGGFGPAHRPVGRAAAAALPPAATRGTRPGGGGRAALRLEHAGLAARRAAGRLPAALVARPAPRLPAGHGLPRRGRGHADAARAGPETPRRCRAPPVADAGGDRPAARLACRPAHGCNLPRARSAPDDLPRPRRILRTLARGGRALLRRRPHQHGERGETVEACSSTTTTPPAR